MRELIGIAAVAFGVWFGCHVGGDPSLVYATIDMLTGYHSTFERAK